jgi:hypothetical protein
LPNQTDCCACAPPHSALTFLLPLSSPVQIGRQVRPAAQPH